MIESASGRLPNYPDHPPAASVGLGSLAPDLFLAFGSRLTSASRSSLVEEVRPASSTPWASYGHVRGMVALW